MKGERVILVADNDKRLREAISYAVDAEGCRVIPVCNQIEALNCLERENVDVVIAALKEPDIDGIKLLEVAKLRNPDVGVVLVTERNTIDVDLAVKAMRAGATDFLTKPVNLDKLAIIINRVFQQQRLISENKELHKQIEENYDHLLTGRSEKIRELRRKISQIAPTNATVLIQGESGTGKELVARAIHLHSFRKDKPFIAFNCAALNENLVESELFGHERGAFTGAYRTRMGRFELADGGTLFLDEIGEMDLRVQAKLLRALETGEFERLGGTKPIKVDVRIIAATNKDLENEVKRGRFRTDLYHRLKVVTVQMPPLRERREDIPLLVERFIEELGRKNGKRVKGITGAALKALMRYDWPGNVRELKNCIESALVVTDGDKITLDDLPDHVLHSIGRKPMDIPPAPATQSDRLGPAYPRIQVGMSMEEVEREIIRATLAYTGNNKTLAAKILNIGKKTIFRKIKKYGIKMDEIEGL
ncbi:sigma-54-dependent Fis family transcriptional regulator [Candidatus Poribacteria bacterium]|nr:sigma-54-dependent Fis family transcriptional regulator [Candidatus Poribacteria bacterium]